MTPGATAFSVPGRASDLQSRLREEHDVLPATGLGDRVDDLLRVGMGYDDDVEKVDVVMDALATELA